MHRIDHATGGCDLCGATREQLDDNLKPDCVPSVVPLVFDISFFEYRPVTRDDVDFWIKAMASFGKFAHVELDGVVSTIAGDAELACYVNPYRDDGLFVAEKREIKPYPGTKLDGSLSYPAIPREGVRFPMQLPHLFARRIVACWNVCRGRTTAELENEASSHV